MITDNKRLPAKIRWLSLGIVFFALCLFTACAELDEYFTGDPRYESLEEVQASERSSNMSQGGGMMPDANSIEQMRASRMGSLNRSPGGGGMSGGMSGSAGQSSQNRQPKEDTQALQAGIEAYNIGDYNQAIGKLDQFINRHPNSDSVPEALFFLGQSYYRIKDYQKAMTTYKKIDSNFSLYPKAGEALYKVGKCLEALGNKDFAVRVFKKVATKYPSFNKDNIKD